MWLACPTQAQRRCGVSSCSCCWTSCGQRMRRQQPWQQARYDMRAGRCLVAMQRLLQCCKRPWTYAAIISRVGTAFKAWGRCLPGYG